MNATEENKKLIAIMGRKDVVSGFKFLGFTPISVDNAQDAKEKFIVFKTNAHKYGILYITEEFYNSLDEEIEKMVEKTTPAIVIIPDNTGSKNIGINLMQKTIEKATGNSMLSE